MKIHNPNNYPTPLKGLKSNGYTYLNSNGVKSIIKDPNRYHKEDCTDYRVKVKRNFDSYNEVGLSKSDFL